MPTQCIHGFPTQHCSSCRACVHGQTTSTCGRCRARVTVRRTASATAIAPEPIEAHAGFEIFYEPAVSGWRYRAQDAPASGVSYRSAFLARKAVDALPVGATAHTRPGKRRR